MSAQKIHHHNVSKTGDSGRPFVMAQQLRDACRKWLMAESRDVEGVIDLVVLEQFIVRLPRRTAEWVQCHRPTSLTQAIQLAEAHMVVCPGVGEPLTNRSLSLSPLLLSPLSLARYQLPGHGCRRPREPHQGVATARGIDGPGVEAGQSPHQHHRRLSGNPLHILLPRGRR